MRNEEVKGIEEREKRESASSGSPPLFNSFPWSTMAVDAIVPAPHRAVQAASAYGEPMPLNPAPVDEMYEYWRRGRPGMVILFSYFRQHAGAPPNPLWGFLMCAGDWHGRVTMTSFRGGRFWRDFAEPYTEQLTIRFRYFETVAERWATVVLNYNPVYQGRFVSTDGLIMMRRVDPPDMRFLDWVLHGAVHRHMDPYPRDGPPLIEELEDDDELCDWRFLADN